MKILILSDSLGLPRNVKGIKVKYENTYPYLLKQKYKEIEIVHVGMGGATIVDIYRQLCYYTVLECELTFIQCGIVDCAPRAFSKFETKVINKLKLRPLTKPFLKFLRKYRKHVYSSLKKFKKYIDLINDKKHNSNEFNYIGILPGSKEYEKTLPNISSQVKKYNLILKKSGNNYIDNSDFNMNGILPDHHHLNDLGNQIIFKKISRIIDDYLNK